MYNPDSSITQYSRALNLFTDRRENIRHFLEYLNDPARNTILFLQGDGGNGKTLLLHVLRTKFCKRLEWKQWESVKTLNSEDLAQYVEKETEFEKVPSALLDFRTDTNQVENERPKHPFYALLMLRRDLVRDGLKADFPLFDFACVMYLFKTGTLTPERLKSLFPPEAIDTVSTLVDMLSGTSYGSLAKSVLSMLSKNITQRFQLYLMERKIEKAHAEQIDGWHAEQELIPNLPFLFAKDLNTVMEKNGAPARIALFFDTHEAFWGHDPSLPDATFFERDQWLRSLVKNLNRQKGIVIVVAGRNKPKWSDATQVKVVDKLLDLQFIGHLPSAYAERYLMQAGIEDSALRQALITYTEVEPGQVHPFHLGLCTDIVLEAKHKNIQLEPSAFNNESLEEKGLELSLDDKGKELISRLLLYVGEDLKYAIRALSACRSFDRTIFFKLGENMKFNASEPLFRHLMQFSFFWSTKERGEGWYRIHDLMRRLLRELDDQDVRRADEFLENYYRGRVEAGEELAQIEAIYHANCLDWQRGVQEWVEIFEQAHQFSKYDLCESLSDLRHEMQVADDFSIGLISQSAGGYFATLAKHREAEAEYRKSIAAYEVTIRLIPDYVDAHNNKGLALLRLGEMQASQAKYEAAEANYREAVVACDTALRLAPDYVNAHINKGGALLGLGQMQASQAKYEAAEANYKEAVVALDTALRLAENHPMIHNNKGLALLKLGEMQASQAKYEAAEANYKAATTVLDTALRLAENHPMIHSNKGLALVGLGQMQASQAKYEAAEASYKEAVVTLDIALQLAPDDINAHTNKGVALLGLGEMQASQSKYEAAEANYKEAVVACGTALRLAENHPMIHSNKGFALLKLGQMQASQSKYEAAEANYKEAVVALDTALRLAENHPMIHNNKGLALLGLGGLQEATERPLEAIVSFEAAVVEYEYISKIIPNNPEIRNNIYLIKTEIDRLKSDK